LPPPPWSQLVSFAFGKQFLKVRYLCYQVVVVLVVVVVVVVVVVERT
jgi:hypothetical protein